MSKNFELMQAIRWSDLTPIPDNHASTSATVDFSEEKMAPEAPAAKVRGEGAYNQIWDQESWKLVQQVFLLPANPLHMVVFAGVDAGTGCSEVCAQAAQSLAAHTSSQVCVVEGNFREPNLERIFGLREGRGSPTRWSPRFRSKSACTS